MQTTIFHMITDQNKLKPNNIQVPLYRSASYTLNMSHNIHHIVALDVLPDQKHINDKFEVKNRTKIIKLNLY